MSRNKAQLYLKDETMASDSAFLHFIVLTFAVLLK